MTPFAAVLLAGGKSRRMGRDKALLPLSDGQLLWQRQLAVLRELEPAELFISGPVRDSSPVGVIPLGDERPGLGPLAGLAVSLATMRSPRLIVLAVDLPRITANFLRRLLVESPDHGIFPQTSDGFFEPLAAIYPRTALPIAEQLLAGPDRSLQTFVRQLLESGQAVVYPLTNQEAALFANWNTPDDLSALDTSSQ